MTRAQTVHTQQEGNEYLDGDPRMGEVMVGACGSSPRIASISSVIHEAKLWAERMNEEKGALKIDEKVWNSPLGEQESDWTRDMWFNGQAAVKAPGVLAAMIKQE